MDSLEKLEARIGEVDGKEEQEGREGEQGWLFKRATIR